MYINHKFLFALLFILACFVPTMSQTLHKVLIVDGQSDHDNWKKSTQMMKAYLEETGLFDVKVATNYPSEGGSLDSFKPDFGEYELVVSNYNGAPWPENIRTGFEDFVKKGGGLVIVHAANNAFPGWEAYNKMIGVGSNRPQEKGPMIYYDEAEGKVVRDNSRGQGSTHTGKYQVMVKIRSKDHPITKGLPAIWMHEQDEIYNELRGPAQNMEVLATSLSPKNKKGTGRHEPVIMAINYGKGRIFHTTLGHDPEAQQGVGFITLIQRGTEWVATGKVSQEVPQDFPGPGRGSKRIK